MSLFSTYQPPPYTQFVQAVGGLLTMLFVVFFTGWFCDWLYQTPERSELRAAQTMQVIVEDPDNPDMARVATVPKFPADPPLPAAQKDEIKGWMIFGVLLLVMTARWAW